MALKDREEATDQHDRPRPKDRLDGEGSPHEDMISSRRMARESEPPDAPVGDITNMDVFSKESYTEHPETDPFLDEDKEENRDDSKS